MYDNLQFQLISIPLLKNTFNNVLISQNQMVVEVLAQLHVDLCQSLVVKTVESQVIRLYQESHTQTA